MLTLSKEFMILFICRMLLIVVVNGKVTTYLWTFVHRQMMICGYEVFD